MKVAVLAGVAALVGSVAVVELAAADPSIVLDKCTALDRVALHAAIQRELAASQVKHDVALVIVCPDAVTAHISIEPAMGLSRTLDLGEVPGDLRVKLLAIAAVELAMAADPSKVNGPASERAGDATPLPTVEQPTDQVAETTPPVVDPDDAKREAKDTITESELPPGPQPSSMALAPRLGVRFFASRPKPMPHATVDFEIDRFGFGLTATRGTDIQDPLGTLTPYLFTAGASFRLTCWGEIQLACLRARVEAGMAGISAKAYVPMVKASDARGFYAQAGIGMDVEHSFGAIGFVAAADASWSEGIVATVEDREPVRLDGLAVTTVLGIRWRP